MIIYTVIIGPYDDLKPPAVITPGWRYICITDQPFESDVWEIRRTAMTGRMAAKEFKINTLFPGISIYIDGSFIINCDLNDFVAKYHTTGKVSLMKHPDRKCVYDEIDACMRLGKDDRTLLTKAWATLKTANVPVKMGLPASGIIIRDGSGEEFLKTWLANVGMCARDQISWALAANQHPEAWELFPYNYHLGTDFLYIPHLHDPKHRQKRIKYYASQGHHQLPDQ